MQIGLTLAKAIFLVSCFKASRDILNPVNDNLSDLIIKANDIEDLSIVKACSNFSKLSDVYEELSKHNLKISEPAMRKLNQKKNLSRRRRINGLDDNKESSESIVTLEVNKNKKMERTHHIVNLDDQDNTYTFTFKIPRVKFNDFAYIQYWVTNEDGLTSELGIGKQRGEEFWKPLIFNTDDNHKTGWFADRFVSWVEAPMSAKRSTIVRDMNLYPETVARLTMQVKENHSHLWINGKYIGAVRTNFGIDYIDFGFEHGYDTDYESIQISKMESWRE
nr:hypothetical protein [Perilla mosaic virus]